MMSFLSRRSSGKTPASAFIEWIAPLARDAVLSWPFLYGYSLFFAAGISIFSRDFHLWIHADNLLTTLSAKIALTPFLWDDSRLGYIFSYILHPFSFLSVYDLYYSEVVLRTMFVAFIPVGLLALYGRKQFGYLLIPAFYLLSYYCNCYTHDTVSAGGVYYYYTSFALLIGTQLLAIKINEVARSPLALAALSIPLLFLCFVTYWVNESLLLFAMPYFAYLYWKGIGDRKFIIFNIVAWVPVMALSRYVEVYGKSYTQLRPDILGPFYFLKNFFFVEPGGGPILAAVLCFLAFGAAIWAIMLWCRPQIEVDKRFRTFFLATFAASAVYVLCASQLAYAAPRLPNSNRYVTILMLFVGFWAPLGYWEMARHLFPALRQKKNAGKVFTRAAAALNILLLAVLAWQFGVPKIRIRADIPPLETIAHAEKANIILASNDTPGHYYHADYWATWPLLFQTLEEGDSLKNAIIPITFRSAAIAKEIDAVLPGAENHDPIRVLCLGADEHICKQMTSQAGFFHFSDYPKTLVARIPYTYEEFTPISVLEFAPMGKGAFGSMLDMVKVYKPAVLTPSHILHIPAAPAPYLVAADYDSIAMRLLPGDYHVSIHCAVEGPAAEGEALGELSIEFPEKGFVFKKETLTNDRGFVKSSFAFSIPDFRLYMPRVLFLWNTAGKATLDCDEFRLSQLQKD